MISIFLLVFLILSVKFNDASLLKITDELAEFHGSQTHVY